MEVNEMRWEKGARHNPTNDNRIIDGIPVSYTIYKSGANYYGEACSPTLSDIAAATNPTTVIQNAIDGLLSNGGLVFLKAGTYALTSPLSITKNNVMLVGEGDFNAVGSEEAADYGTKLEVATAIDAIDITGTGAGKDSIQGCLIQDLWIKGSGKSNGVKGIDLNYTDQVRINRVSVAAYNYGVYGANVDATRIEDSWLCYNGYGAYFTNPLYTKILNNEISDNDDDGIKIILSSGDFTHVLIDGDSFKDNGANGINLENAFTVKIINTDLISNDEDGIQLNNGKYTKIIDNNILDNVQHGIAVGGDSDNCHIMGNSIYRNDYANSATYDGVCIYGTSCNNIITNNRILDNDRYEVSTDATANYNTIKNNDFTGTDRELIIYDLGTGNKFHTVNVPFIKELNGTLETTSPIGVLIDAATETALTWGVLPAEVQQAIRLKIWAIAKGAPVNAGGQMHGEFTWNAGGSLEDYNLAANSWNLTNFDSEEADYAANKVIHWVIEDGDVGNELRALAGGDVFELHVIYESAADPDGATNAVIRSVEIEYV